MYYGHYTSANNDGKGFITEAQDDLRFPPQVIYNNGSYRYVKAYQTNTPSQIKQFEEFCKKMSLETGVSIK